MTPGRLRRRAAARILSAAIAMSCAAGVVGVGQDAVADPLDDARARAAALADTVDRLQTEAELAIEKYDAAEAELAEAVTRRDFAERRLEADQAVVQAANDQVEARVRALYEMGGRATLLATVLDGSDPADAAARLHVVGNLLSFDTADVKDALATTARARSLSEQLTTSAAEVTRLQHAAATAAGRVRGLLARQERALASATKQVRRLTRERQAERAAASAAAFNAALAAAGGLISGGTTAPNATVAGALAAARTRLGDPYVWGATGPHAFDCSGLVQWAYARVGVTLPRVAADQYNAGPHVTLDSLEPGDLLFWADDLTDPATIHHVAMYVGGSMMIAAPHTGDVVKIQPVYMTGYIGATRPFG